MLENDIVKLLQKNGGTNKKSGGDVRVQYNKKDITAIFKKSALEKLGVEKLENYHFSNVEQLQKALDEIENKKGIKLTIA